jgi:aminoglycoside phosphotransferase (APT) family kinase protein
VSSQQLIKLTLLSMKADLEVLIMPNVNEADALRSAQMIAELMGILAIWQEDNPGDLNEYLRVLRSLESSQCGETTSQILTGDVPGAEGIDTATNALQTAIEDFRSFSKADLRAILLADSNRYKTERADVVNASAHTQAAIDKVSVPLTVERAQQLLDVTLGPGFTASAVTRVAGGFSKESFFLDASDAKGHIEQMMIRRDLPFGPAGTNVVDEFALLQALHRSGFQVAEPLGCDSTCITGQPAMISRRVAGTSGTAEWEGNSTARQAICRQLATILAQLHCLDPCAHGLSPASGDPRKDVQSYILQWQDRWRRYRVHTSPTLAAAYVWLLANIPQRIDRAAIVHGDVGFHNSIIREGEYIALLDWEFAHVGDPTEDLSYVRPMVEALMPWDDFIATYLSAGGAPYRDENARFFEVWRSVRNSTTTATAWRGFLSGSNPSLKMAYQGIPLYRYFVSNVAERLAEELA